MKVEKFTQILEEGNTAEDLIKALRFNKMIIDNTERLNDTDGAIVYALMARYLKAKSSTEEEGNSPCLEKYELQEAVKRTTGKPISERDVRKRCRALLAQGFPILSSSSHRGFYVSDNIEEIERCRLQNYNRAMELLKINAGYNKVIELVKGQKSLDEILTN